MAMERGHLAEFKSRTLDDINIDSEGLKVFIYSFIFTFVSGKNKSVLSTVIKYL